MRTSLFDSMQSAVKNWWMSVLLGILYVILGFWVFSTPLESYVTLTMVFSIFIFASGIMEIAFAVANSNQTVGWGWYLTGGILDLIIGILLISNPLITMAILPFYIGFWLMFRGMMAVGLSIPLKTVGMRNWGWMLIAGIATIIFAFLIISNPLFGSMSIVYTSAVAFIMVGVFRIFLGFSLKAFNLK
ncbi:HdeD family acid-resistance protein [Putridiphycobacter roseus]|uniref:HdeD family acid-resistance protein n=1 Tax=Putridiphycobacter roseus TaxID=2219161 RepID=A0A2W1NDN5_9FLAO|nr:DUF308 domain-containing protein [Putridiphycobacter roseus]PZE17535.1 HdeD family acid-resistance protein [Putridiphycobacter roseus]